MDVTMTSQSNGPIPNISYPTRCLSFLKAFNRDRTDTREYAASALKLNVLVIGAGIGGLSTAVALARRGHSVKVLEQAPKLGEVGAGIQVPPNSARLLLDWGIGRFLSDLVIEPEGMTFRRWENGEPIGYTPLIPEFRQNFGAPYYVVHRAHLHTALHELAVQYGAELITNAKVVKCDPEIPCVKTEDGNVFIADLVIGADGIKSTARTVVLGGTDLPPQRTKFAAYRATVDVTKMRADPDVAPLLENPAINIWIGEDKHVMTYCIAGGKSFNMVLSHPDSSDPDTWTVETALKDMRNCFAEWDIRLRKTINMIEKTMKWPLYSGIRLPRWVAPSCKLLILGDAAHAMLPYMSQGAAMAVEDAAALAETLAFVKDLAELPAALKVFEKERMGRAGDMQTASLVNGMLWHFPDGPEQRARDASMRPEVEGKHFVESANQWSDPTTQLWAYGYDAEEAIRKVWGEQCARGKHVAANGHPNKK